MTVIDLARQIRAMRDAQRAYFRSRSSEDLERSRALERAVDRTLTSILSGQAAQPSLFPDPEPTGPYGRGGAP